MSILGEYLELVRAATAEIESLRSRLASADREATVLVVAMADQCGAPDNWKPLPDVAGKITQISNMVAGLRSRLAEAEGREKMLLNRCDVLEEERNDSDNRLAEAERDAARYRWLVSQGDPIIWNYLGGMDDDQIDEAIDKWIADDAHLSRKEGET